MLVLHEEVRETRAAGAGESGGIAVTQVYFDPLSQRVEGGEVKEKYVDSEMLPQRPYGCRVVVTNATAKTQKCSLLLQIPVGAIPLNLGGNGRGVSVTNALSCFRTKTQFTSVRAYHTYVAEYFFYFPAVGSFGHYPVQVSQTEGQATVVIGSGSPTTLSVVAVLSAPPDAKSWHFISQVRIGLNTTTSTIITRNNRMSSNMLLFCYDQTHHSPLSCFTLFLSV